MTAAFDMATPEMLIAVRQKLRDNGYHPIPVNGKVPGLPEWQNCTNVTHETIQKWSRSRRHEKNTGILTGKSAGVDIDVLNADISARLVARAFELFGPSPLRRIGRAPKTLLLYRLEAPHPKISTPDLFFGDDVTNKEAKAKVEVLLVGQQVVVHGIHPDTHAPYLWPERTPLEMHADEAPIVTPDLLKQFVSDAEQILRNAGARTEQEIKGRKSSDKKDRSFKDAMHELGKPSRPRVEELLNHVPNDKSYDAWVRIGFAIYDALGDHGRDLWEQWSAKSDKNDPDFTARKWPSFATCPEGKDPITYKTLFFEAKNNGWRQSEHEAALDEMNAQFFVAKEGGKTWVISFERDHARLVPTYMRFSDFTNLYMNRSVKIEDGKKVQYVPLGKWWLQHPERQQYDGLVFAPGNPAAVIDGRFNLWRGWGVEPRRGNWKLMRKHIWLVLAAKDKERFKYTMRWLAWMVQHPDQRAEVALVFKGNKGTGKGTLGNCLMKMFGQHSLQISNAKHLVGNFNAHMRDTCFLFGDECYWPGDKQAEGTLKRLITEPTLFIEAKGRDAITVPNYLHVMLASNEQWIVPAGENERRYFMNAVSEAKMQNKKWFKAIDDQLKNGGYQAMLFDLMNYRLADWHPREVPKASGLVEQQARSLAPLDGWWVELLETGTLAGCDPEGPADRAVSNKYEEKVVVGMSDRLVTRPGLYDQARSIEPRLRNHTSDHHLGTFLKEQGCSNERKIMRRRGWIFPPLSVCRAKWEKRFPGWPWRDPDIKEWRLEDQDDDYKP
jgi:Family of unknown function (DUF5906)/Primase C terminal 2 (PriCT-2)/Bifunctional DNA primase/polymerase, N-terminal